jgi:hypothetical protein
MAVCNIKKSKEISIELLKENFYVKDGVLYWRKDNHKKWADTIAGYPNKMGYYDIGFLKNRYYAHRIVFAITHGYWPSGIIDHIDGNSSNNSPENLREVSDSENSINSKRSHFSKGVYSHTGGWQAEITFKKKRYRKWFKNRQDAVDWRANVKYNVHKIGDYNG